MNLHQDPITKENRLVAPNRAERLKVHTTGCPFCPGNESATPIETGRITAEEEPYWRARAFPNLFPLTSQHEVLVPTARHVTSWRELELPELFDALTLLLIRHRALQQTNRYVHAFVNDGAQAGASIPHVHAQLVSVIRAENTERLIRGVRTEGCGICALIESESDLLIETGREHALLAHPMPRLGGGLLIAPLTHRSSLNESYIEHLAALVRRALLSIPADQALNMWLVADPDNAAHWYLEIQPRTATLAGVELGLGLHVIAQTPEDTAQNTRERLALFAR